MVFGNLLFNFVFCLGRGDSGDDARGIFVEDGERALAELIAIAPWITRLRRRGKCKGLGTKGCRRLGVHVVYVYLEFEMKSLVI